MSPMLLATGFPPSDFPARGISPQIYYMPYLRNWLRKCPPFLSHLKGLYGGLHFTLALYYYLRGRSTVRQGNGGLEL